MNKKLIALAVAGACVAPTVMAQTANPVTLYGRIYLTAESVKAEGSPIAANNANNRTRISDQASYLGVRGTEDLGGGLKAVFQLETAFAPDDASGTFANRNSMVGLQGNWGTAFFGRWDSPMKMSQTAVDVYGDLTIGDITGAALDQGNFSRRTANQISYWTPDWSGFNAKLMWSPNEGKTATANPQQYGASLTYAKGPLYLAYSYEEHKDMVGTTATPNAKEDGNAFAARYAFGNWRLMGQYGEYKKSAPGSSVKDKSFYVGTDYAMGKHVLIGSYQHAEQGTGDCDMWSVGYRYDFSKRTFFIASYAEVDNSSSTTDAAANMNCNFGTAALGGAGADPKGFGLGVRHVF
ncbi:MAG: porin [Betaproteobacteria bacterium]|nr:porin [Betaproteobacteria bacterium]